jgi:NAD(P)-dependent dehydrogenase (short-subunit alcohol dehydrogenase family)
MTGNQRWTTADMPDQSGRIAIITGANSGIGYETARALVKKGAAVVMACRNLQKAGAAADELRAERPAGPVEVMALDLADLDSVRAFAAACQGRYDQLDLLINNAGMAAPPHCKTVQGFEIHFGANHLGHFALTGLLLEPLLKTAGSRIVTVSSVSHKFGRLDFDDPHWQEPVTRPFRPNRAYGRSKLANLLFAYELQRRLAAAGHEALSVAAHPGWTDTKLPRQANWIRFFTRFFAQDTKMGALPTLYAATASTVKGGDYIGPGGFFELRGHPKKVSSNALSHDQTVAGRLWSVSEAMTGTNYPF